jgi:hypothetical protein
MSERSRQVKKSSVGRATEKRPIQKARGIKDTARKHYFAGILTSGRSIFLACLGGLGVLTTNRAGVQFPARPVVSISIIVAELIYLSRQKRYSL